jgi:hypothetical protein
MKRLKEMENLIIHRSSMFCLTSWVELLKRSMLICLLTRAKEGLI